MRSILLLFAALLLPAFACAQSQPPEDGGKYTVIVVTAGNPSPTAQQLVYWLATDPGLSELMSRVHYHQLTADNPLYQQRYAATLPQTPVIALVRPDGGVEYKASGANLPRTAESLREDMLYYHHLMPYYPPATYQQAWPDTRDYAQSQGYPLRDSSHIAPRSSPGIASGINPITLLLIAATVFITLSIIGLIAWLLLQDE